MQVIWKKFRKEHKIIAPPNQIMKNQNKTKEHVIQ